MNFKSHKKEVDQRQLLLFLCIVYYYPASGSNGIPEAFGALDFLEVMAKTIKVTT